MQLPFTIPKSRGELAGSSPATFNSQGMLLAWTYGDCQDQLLTPSNMPWMWGDSLLRDGEDMGKKHADKGTSNQDVSGSQRALHSGSENT